MTRTIHFVSDDQRRQYELKVTLKVECTLRLLAANDHDAHTQARVVDLHRFFGFTQDNLSTDDEGLLTIRNVTVVPTPIDLRQLPLDTNPPNDHPDFIGGGKAWRR